VAAPPEQTQEPRTGGRRKIPLCRIYPCEFGNGEEATLHRPKPTVGEPDPAGYVGESAQGTARDGGGAPPTRGNNDD